MNPAATTETMMANEYRKLVVANKEAGFAVEKEDAAESKPRLDEKSFSRGMYVLVAI